MTTINNNMAEHFNSLTVVVPAAGVGKRMLANCPKQYLTIGDLTILEHTVNRLLSHPAISKVILSISHADDYFRDTSLANHKNVITVFGGEERVDSVLAGIKAIDIKTDRWVLVHDAARPCILLDDIDALINSCRIHDIGGLLATPVRDTMKHSTSLGQNLQVKNTLDRTTLWHALTPQMFKTEELRLAIEQARADGVEITDESSAIEYVNLPSMLVPGRSDNIKITRPEDLALARFFLAEQQDNVCE